MNKKEIFEQIKKKKSYLCVGLDTDIKKIPAHLLHTDDPVFEFNKQIIEATKEFCVAYKPNIAFYEARGHEGLRSLEKTLSIIPPDIFTIADAKRGDMGNTAEMYARAFFDYYHFDSITLSPYLGRDSISPFLVPGKWAILLAVTSNAGSMDFQLAEMNPEFVGGDKKLFEHILHVSEKWGSAENMMYVVGATHPDLVKQVRAIVPEHFLLIPGVGAQGGDLEAISLAGMNDECGILVNSSRQILYASPGKDFAEKAGEEAKNLQLEMSRLLESRI